MASVLSAELHPKGIESPESSRFCPAGSSESHREVLKDHVERPEYDLALDLNHTLEVLKDDLLHVGRELMEV